MELQKFTWLIIVFTLFIPIVTNNSTETSTETAPTTLPSPTSQPSTLWVNLTDVTKLVIKMGKNVSLTIIDKASKNFANWGGRMTTILIPNSSKLKRDWDMLNLVFTSGVQYERARQEFKKLDTSKAWEWLTKNVEVALNTGIKLTLTGLGGFEQNLANNYTGSVYINTPKKPSVPKWPGFVENEYFNLQCTGERKVVNQAFKSFNIEVQYERQEPTIIVAYTTLFLGIETKGCKATAENHGQISMLSELGSYIPTEDEVNSTYPVVHVILNQHDLDSVCEITLCSIPEQHFRKPGEIKPFKAEKITFAFKPPMPPKGANRRLLSLDTGGLKGRCNTGTRIISAIKYQVHAVGHSKPGPYKAFCNGTHVANHLMGEEHGCYSVSRSIAKVQCPTDPLAVSNDSSSCTFSKVSDSCPKDKTCIEVHTQLRGPVKVTTDKEHLLEDCSGECSFTLRGKSAVIICPNGETHQFVSSVIDTKCPLAEYGRLPVWVCRMSFRPTAVYLLAAWYLLGYIIWRVVVFFLCLVVRLVTMCFKYIRIRNDPSRGVCEKCNQFVPSRYHWQRHENCNNGRCPYCRLSQSRDRLAIHVKDCVQKEKCTEEDNEAVAVKLIPTWIRVSLAAMNAFSSISAKVAWLVGIFVLMYLCVHPVSALKDTAPGQDIWSEEVKFVDFCDISCAQTETDCACDPQEEGHKSRKLMLWEDPGLFIKKLMEASNRTKQVQRKKLNRPEHSMRRSVDVTAPWGSLHIGDAYSPSYSGSHISLTWNEVSATDDHVTINGKSQAVLKLEVGTGLMWEIKNEKSSEVRRVFISILDFTQQYSTRFMYATGDRIVGNWMHGRCKGDCPHNCDCNHKLCTYNSYQHFTNWRCNPTWCWEIGTGCVCCALSVTEYFHDWFVTKWELEYIDTPVIACLESSASDRICQVVSAGSVLQAGPISVQFSDPTGIEKKLPKTVLMFHKTPEQPIFDLARKVKMVDGKMGCKIQSCTHGPVGDVQYYNIEGLLDGDHINIKGDIRPEFENSTGVWISWAGTSTYYTCHTGHWPDCHSTGVVEHNAEAFRNAWNSGNASGDFFFHTEEIRVENGPPTLNLKARPNWGGGQIQVLLDVQGLTLKAKKVRPEGVKLELNHCEGCFGCSTGFTCVVRLSISSPDQFSMHLVSADTDIIAPSSSIIARSDRVESIESRFFASHEVKEMCLEVKETLEDDVPVRTCVSLNLRPQEEVLLENRVTLHSTSNATCGDSYWYCLTSNISSFWLSFGDMVRRIFGGLVGGLIFIVIVGLIIFLSVFFGPGIFRFLISCFLKRRAGYQAVPFEEIREEYRRAREEVEEEKKKGKHAAALLTKFSKLV